MYVVYAITEEDATMIACFNGTPAVFNEDSDAWNFIENMMKQEEHPKMAWVKEVAYGDPQ